MAILDTAWFKMSRKGARSSAHMTLCPHGFIKHSIAPCPLSFNTYLLVCKPCIMSYRDEQRNELWKRRKGDR